MNRSVIQWVLRLHTRHPSSKRTGQGEGITLECHKQLNRVHRRYVATNVKGFERDETLDAWFLQRGGRSKAMVGKYVEKDGKQIDNPRRGMFAKEDIPSGGEVLLVPSNLIINKEMCNKSLIGPLLPWATEKLEREDFAAAKSRDTSCQALFLLHESMNPNSIWAPWIKALPRKVYNSLELDEDTLELFDETESGYAIRAYITAYQQSYNNSTTFKEFPHAFPANQFGGSEKWNVCISRDAEAAFKWGYNAVWTRSIFLNDDAKLIPYFDFINHPDTGNRGNVDVMEVEGKNCRLQATRDIKQGEELFFSYGEKPNGKLFSMYGFILDRNEHDSVTSWLMPRDNTPFRKKALKYLEGAGFTPRTRGEMSPFMITLKSSDQLFNDYLPVVRYLWLNEEIHNELKALGHNFEQVRQALPMYEKNVALYAEDILRSEFKRRYPTEIRDDELKLKSETDPMKRIAYTLRLHEKKLFKRFIGDLHNYAAKLK